MLVEYPWHVDQGSCCVVMQGACLLNMASQLGLVDGEHNGSITCQLAA